MPKPIPPLRRFAVPFLAFAGGMGTMALLGAPSAQATPMNESPYSAIGQLGRVLVEVENEYVEPVDRAKLLNGAIKGMVSELDPHSSYMPPQDFTLFQNDTEGKFGGVGIEVDGRDDVLTVLATIEGTPAEHAGIKSGDRIVAVDGITAAGGSLERVVRKMRGVAGTHVKLSIVREGVDHVLVFDLVREEIHVPSVAARMLDGNIAYVRIKQFQEHTHDELVNAVGRLRQESPRIDGVILDLRTNPGGLVDEATEVADEFISDGTIYTTRHRGQIIDDVKARGGGAFGDAPAVVLVNEYSASASELVAGALQDSRRALVVGARTFGKGSVQSILSLPGGAGLKLTTARYYTPSGHSVQADGIKPDVVIESAHPGVEGAQFLRERDLEGHLPAEGPSGTTPELAPTDAGTPGAIVAPPDASLLPDSLHTDARNVPKDPAQGNDFVLRMGYQVMKTLVGKGPIVR